MPQYSLWKGFKKGLVSALTIAASMLTLAGLSEITLWDLVVEHIKPLLGSLTVGGLFTMAINYIKVRSQEG